MGIDTAVQDGVKKYGSNSSKVVPTNISLLNRPGRRNEGSIAQGSFVQARTVIEESRCQSER